jgi:ABC-type uncharacterized transport system substrate-binding protein
MTGPQATDKPYTSPSAITQRFAANGIRIYPIAVGRGVNQAEVMSFTRNADDVTYTPDYRQLRPAAASLGVAVRQGKSIH